NASINVNSPASGLFTVVVADWTGGREGSHVGDYVLTASGISTCPSPPTTFADAYSTAVNTPLNVASPGVLANDNTNGGGAMTAELVTTATTGTLVLNANGGFTYTPPNGFTGPVTFTYRALNAFGPGNVATVTITVTAVPVPTTNADSYNASIGSPLNVAAPGVLANDASNGGGALTAELITTTTQGVLTLNTNGSFTYTSNPGFVGTDTFTYRAVSSAGPGNTATVTIMVESTPQGPIGLYAASISGNTVTLRWTPPVGGMPPTNYVLEGGVSPGQVLASIPTGSTTPIFTFTAPSGAFYVRLHTLSGSTRSVASNEIRIFVNTPAAPSAPTNLTGMANGSAIALAWRNTFAGGAPGGVVLDVSGSLNTSLPLGLTDNFQFNGVPGGTYTLSLRAINASGSSPSSNAITLSFPSPTCSGAPLPPSGFLAYRVGNTINVLWDPATTGAAPTSFVLNVSGGFNGSFAVPGRTLSGPVGPGSYNLSVAAVNACGTSAATAVQTVVVP
ncbi:MAG: Ig-like domain-containing protein, partial [Acidobacteriota bacterium]|nr:Ig-like domain-containing protein [Acidobacteriota bacterium]